MTQSQESRVEVIAVHVFGSCFPEWWHESEVAPPGYAAVATVMVDGVEHQLDYGLSVAGNLDLIVRAAWEEGEVDLTPEERAAMNSIVADMIDKAFEGGCVGGTISEDDFAPQPPLKPDDGIPAFIRKRMEVEAAAPDSLKM